MSGMWRLKFFWLLSTRLIALRSCLLSRQQRLEVTTKVWSTVLGQVEPRWDLGHDLSSLIWISVLAPHHLEDDDYLGEQNLVSDGQTTYHFKMPVAHTTLSGRSWWGLLTCPSWSIFDYSRKVLKAASWGAEVTSISTASLRSLSILEFSFTCLFGQFLGLIHKWKESICTRMFLVHVIHHSFVLEA